MSGTLYRDVLMDHMKHPRFSGKVEPADLRAAVNNPLCGDELELTIALDGPLIREARILARGCSVCVASASLMGEAIQGCSLEESSRLSQMFREAMASGTLPDPPPEFLPPLMQIRQHKSRVKCAALAWNALDECLHHAAFPDEEKR